ncbi:hypothetical protein [Desulfobacula sp.]|uniref:hypothetical protein n=1 Tax=Desulfobacula sp. TaxID=2593537 RepID=UPI002617B102|nr:hypothetical protein [Desulfobacula sp.]
MKKFFFISLLIVSLILFPLIILAESDMGQAIVKNKAINIVICGSMKVLPPFIENADFNKDKVRYEFH